MEYHRGIRIIMKADRLGSICENKCCPFFNPEKDLKKGREKSLFLRRMLNYGIQIRHRNRTGMCHGANHKDCRKAGIDEKYLEQYGKYKAKIDYNLLKESDAPNGKLILVTAINPTPAGEGKTTTTVGLADGMQKLGKKVMVALREPSLGPVFGVKGGAAGGGYAQVVPMEDINLHFTGDFHAIGAANNLLAAMLDNHIYQGNELNIDPRKITWRRCVDMNDRQLRFIVDGLGGKTNGKPREDGYDITVASEIMAVLCLASDITDLKARLGRIIVGYTMEKLPKRNRLPLMTFMQKALCAHC